MTIQSQTTNKDKIRSAFDANQNRVRNAKNEINKVNELYEKKMLQARTEGDTNYNNELINQKNRLVDLKLDNESKLEAAKAFSQNEISRLEKARNDLIENYQKRISNSETFYKDKATDSDIKSKEQSANIIEKNRQFIHELEEGTKSDQQKLISKSKKEISDKERSHARTIKENDQSFSRKIKTLEIEQASQEASLNLKNDKELEKIKYEAEKVKKDTVTQQNHELMTMQGQHKENIDNKVNSFNQRYQTLVENQEKVLNDTREYFKNELNSLIKDHSAKKSSINNHSQDPFYRMTTLDYSVTETPSELTISIPTPEHEKDSYKVNLNGDKIAITLARRFSQKSVDSQKETLAKSLRSESLYEEFITNAHLDSRKITRSYANGILSYTIAKK